MLMACGNVSAAIENSTAALQDTLLADSLTQKKSRNKSYFEFRAGYEIGGTVPFPLPAQMRKINGFSPLGNFSVQALGNIPMCKHWEWMLGLRFERKGMTSDATVKDYNMSIQDDDGGLISGRWTGDVSMTADQWMLTLPLSISYKFTDVGKLRLGTYFGFVAKGKFYGEVCNGYLREVDPTGAKIEIDDKPQSFDFSGDLRKFQWGLTVGGEWRLCRRLMAFIDLDWGLNDIFVNDFQTITFDMFPIFGTVGVGYQFR